mgnify:CR=1 FL=1
MKEKIITFGEIMLRLSPENSERFTQCHSFEAVYGGGEANTAVSLSNFGVDAAYVTKLPKHAIGQSAVNALRQYGVDVSKIVRGGDQIGIYFLEKKTSQRPSNVIYNRSGSAIALQKKVILTGMPFLQMQHGSIFQESHRQSAIHWLRSA